MVRLVGEAFERERNCFHVHHVVQRLKWLQWLLIAFVECNISSFETGLLHWKIVVIDIECFHHFWIVIQREGLSG